MFSLGPRMVRPRGWPEVRRERVSRSVTPVDIAHPLTLERNSVQVVKDNLLKLLVNLLLLAEDDITLALDSTRLELASLENVGDDLDTLSNVLSERLGVVDSLFPRGVGVEVGAQVLNLELQLVL